MSLPIGPEVVPFYGLYLESYKVYPNKELLRGLWVFWDVRGSLLGPLHRGSTAGEARILTSLGLADPSCKSVQSR